MSGERSSDPLRTRYYDWCSAKVAERFLELSPEEIWRRAAELPAPGGPEGPEGSEEAFPTGSAFFLARRLANQLAQELELPSYAAWLELYRSDPTRFEREIVAERGMPDPPLPQGSA